LQQKHVVASMSILSQPESHNTSKLYLG